MSLSSKGLLFQAIVLAVTAADLEAQQFVHVPGALPGVSMWSEGVTCVDIDLDGDLDVLFANGEGFGAPGVKRRATVLVNQTVGGGGGGFTDESLPRLGPQVSNGKSIVAGDLTGDGYPDLVIANAYNTDVTYLMINRGASQPGFFDFESITRGFTSSVSSNSVALGDVDSDGDLDILLSDSGLDFLTGLGDRPRLYRNNGLGFFTFDPAAISAQPKVAQMDIQLADVDGDFDLDFIGTNRASNLGGNHYLLLNDGSGVFVDSSSQFAADATASFALEAADLDNDGDVDLFALGTTGTSAGVVENGLAQGGGLFASRAATTGPVENRDVGLLDWDNDGDFDVILGGRVSDEAAWRNDGALLFVEEPGLFPMSGDATLDFAIADLDNDGAYDLVTAQGQDVPGDWANKVYLNTGAADTLAPVLEEVLEPDVVLQNQDVVVLARVRDQVMDDGMAYLKGVAYSAVPIGAPEQSVVIDATSFSPPAISISPGTRVIWDNVSGVDQTVTSLTGPSGFDSGTLGTSTFERVFVRPGVYTYTSSTSGAVAQVTVTSGAVTTQGTDSGGGIFRFEMPDSSFGAGVEMHYELEFTDWPGNVAQVQPSAVLLGNCVSASVCVTTQNSIGPGALIGMKGTTSLSANNMTLQTDRMPRGAGGIYFFGPNQVQSPLGQGLRCAGGGITRIAFVFSDSTGHAELPIDLTQIVGTAPQITPGTILFFQHWYRDVEADGTTPTTNLSDGLRVSFCP